MNLRQIRAFVAVAEEGSFSKGAVRENATQSGMSQHVQGLEAQLGTALLERGRDGVSLTLAGERYYLHCVNALRELQSGQQAVQDLTQQVSGVLRAGLMPAFTRAALAPALARFAACYPQVSVQVTEAYSGALSDMVRSDELDFALVPAGPNDPALRVSLLSRDTEMLVSSPKFGLKPLEPVQLNQLAPLKLIVPGKSNVRRANLQRYLDTNQVKVESMIEMDAMIGTLELIARSDWVAILPGLILAPDQAGQARVINPIASPSMGAEFVVIEPARSKLSRPAGLFLEEIRAEVSTITQRWSELL